MTSDDVYKLAMRVFDNPRKAEDYQRAVAWAKLEAQLAAEAE